MYRVEVHYTKDEAGEENGFEGRSLAEVTTGKQAAQEHFFKNWGNHHNGQSHTDAWHQGVFHHFGEAFVARQVLCGSRNAVGHQ